MATATIIKVWQTPDKIHVAARVSEGGQQGNVEYIAWVPNDDAWAVMSAAEKKAALTTALKARRDEQQATNTPVAGITGTVTV